MTSHSGIDATVHPLFDADAARLHLDALFGSVVGEEPACFAALAVGIGWDPDSKRHADWQEHHFSLAEGLTAIVEWAGFQVGLLRDVYVNYHPRTERSRRKGSSRLQGRTLWVDGDDGLRYDAAQRVKEAGGWIVASGTVGHLHLGLTLDEEVDQDFIESGNRSLADALGGDAKWSSESLLRLAGTRNMKTGGDGTPVDFVVKPTRAITTEDYVRLLSNAKDKTGTRSSKAAVTKTAPGARNAVKFDRSAFAYADISDLVEQGKTDAEIVSAIKSDLFGDGAWSHYRGEQQLRDDIARIRGKIADEQAQQRSLIESHGFDPRALAEQTEQGAALRFVQALASRAHYVPESGRWYVWTGRQWSEDRLGEVTARLMDFNDEHYTEATTTAKWVTLSRKRSTMLGVLGLAAAHRTIALSQTRFDADPHVLNAPNGLIDLKARRIDPHDPGMLVTKSTAVPCDLDATPVGFLTFLDETFAGQPDAIKEYLLDALGYALNGEVTEHLLLILHGLGANGKSTLVEILYGVLGDYAMPAPATLLIADGTTHHPTEVADLKGARLVFVQETEENAQFAEAKVKQLTGGDALKARFMRQDFFSFRPSHTMLLVTNHKPQVRSGGQSFWRRARLLPFANTVPDDRMQPTLAADLVRSEGSAILGLLVRRAQQYYDGGLTTPDAVKNSTDSYRGETDPLHRWSKECLLVQEGAHVLEADLWTCYLAWCTDEDVQRIDQRPWRKYLKADLRLTDRRSNNIRTWHGARLAREAPLKPSPQARPPFGDLLRASDSQVSQMPTIGPPWEASK
jgi:P4 family phage/plasmid primase-like protien